MNDEQDNTLRPIPEQVHFVTGRLAEHSLQEVLRELAPRAGFQYTVQVLPITVAALMTTEWIASRINVPDEAQRVVLPGYCGGDLAVVQQAASGRAVERGPRDLRRLPEFFGESKLRDDYGAYDIEIIGEINHVPRLSLATVLAEAKRLAAEGADVIDVGCDPGDAWSGVGEVVRALVSEGRRVSIDSLNPREIEPAVRAGAELVLSVNRANREAAADWGCEVVVIPDSPRELSSLDETAEYLAARRVRVRLDAVLEPIGFGFAGSVARYVQVRERYPDAEMLMGIGNITELVDADSAAANVLLLGICQELGVKSVLTTEVVHWAQSSVRECDLARRLMHYALTHNTLAKHLEPRLIPLRGMQPVGQGAAALDRLATEIKDNNYRIFAEDDRLHLISAGMHLRGSDPFLLFAELLSRGSKNLDREHAFYLGYEMAKAVTALTLDKEYQQDEALDWGYLTRAEVSHRLKRTRGGDSAADGGGDE
jgi:dihydropteroate synthase-like protein